MLPNPLFPILPFHGLHEEDSNAGEGGGGDPNAGKGGSGDGEARLAMLEKAVGLIAKGHQELTTGISALTSKIEQIGQPALNKQGGQGEEEDVDLETMDRKTFTSYLMGQLKSVVEEQVKPLGERFGQLDEKIDGQSLSILIKEFSSDHPDFFEWTPEIKALVKEHPTLTPARLYTLARSENAAKAKKLDEKYGLNKSTERRNGDDIPLSFFPSSSATSATKGAPGRMTPKQAAEAAWDSVMSQIP